MRGHGDTAQRQAGGRRTFPPRPGRPPATAAPASRAPIRLTLTLTLTLALTLTLTCEAQNMPNRAYQSWMCWSMTGLRAGAAWFPPG